MMTRNSNSAHLAGVLPLTLLVLVLGAGAPAQKPVFANGQLVGWTAVPSPIPGGTIDVQRAFPPCQGSKTLCRTVLNYNKLAWAGGTAYDPGTQVAWVSDGNWIEGRRTADCRRLCLFRATKVIPVASSTVSGLAFGYLPTGAVFQKRLFQLETIPGRAAIVTYAPASLTPCWKPVAKCFLSLPANWTAGGITYDPVHSMLFVIASGRNISNVWTHYIYGFKGGSPCTLVCRASIRGCANAMATGLGYAPSKNRLYVSFGAVTQWLGVGSASSCRFFTSTLSCCKKDLNPWRGIAVIPGWTRAGVGRSCYGRGCRACTPFASTAGGDPALGNPNFAVTLGGAQGGQIGFLILGGGACTRGLQIPGLCGPIYPPLFPVPPLVLGPVKIAGIACLGTARVPLPIPPDPRLAGRSLCGQWAIVCMVVPRPGISLSQAVDFRIAGI